MSHAEYCDELHERKMMHEWMGWMGRLDGLDGSDGRYGRMDGWIGRI
jgi:hypothetical protein